MIQKNEPLLNKKIEDFLCLSVKWQRLGLSTLLSKRTRTKSYNYIFYISDHEIYFLIIKIINIRQYRLLNRYSQFNTNLKGGKL